MKGPSWKIRLSTYTILGLILYGMFGCKTIHERDLFYPRHVPRPLAIPGRIDLHIPTSSETELGGWWLQHPGSERMLIYFYGNGETVADSEDRMARLATQLNTDTICVDYRGYGFSDGQPGIAALLEDALTIYDYCRSQGEAEGKEVYLYGRSLGTISALQIAAEREVKGMVLEAPFTSAADVIRAWNGNLPIPFRWIVRLRPEKALKRKPQPIDMIRTYEGPLLVIHGDQDEVIPQLLGRAMYEACPSPRKQWRGVEQAGHNNLSLNRPEVEEALVGFVAGID